MKDDLHHSRHHLPLYISTPSKITVRTEFRVIVAFNHEDASPFLHSSWFFDNCQVHSSNPGIYPEIMTVGFRIETRRS